MEVNLHLPDNWTDFVLMWFVHKYKIYRRRFEWQDLINMWAFTGSHYYVKPRISIIYCSYVCHKKGNIDWCENMFAMGFLFYAHCEQSGIIGHKLYHLMVFIKHRCQSWWKLMLINLLYKKKYRVEKLTL